MSIIFVHELGHFLAAKYYRWDTDKIYIYPLGGITKFNDLVNNSLFQEFIIVLMGPIFQIIYFLILLKFGVCDIYLFNFVLLVFNLLPIYPLDGGKILNIFLSFILPYRKSFNITLVISFIVYVLFFLFLILFYGNFFFLVVFFFLFFKVFDEVKKRRYYFNKFLLERYLENFYFKRVKYVSDVYGMYKGARHYFDCDGVVFTEKYILKKYFK